MANPIWIERQPLDRYSPRVNPGRKIILLSVVLAGVLIAWLWCGPGFTVRRPSHAPLLVYAAAGLKPQIEAIAAAYEQETGVPMQLQFGGSGTLLGNVRVAQRGDLFLAGDESYLDLGRSNKLVAEILPVAGMHAVVCVARVNPLHIRSIEDLLRADVRLALANPDAASIGHSLRLGLGAGGLAAALEKHAKVLHPTVTDVANDVKLGAADAGIVWDATVKLYPDLEALALPALASVRQRVAAGVLKSTQQPAAALRFARYLTARDRGLREFAKAGFDVVDGDAWAPTPEVVLFSGGVNRLAVDETITAFEQREGCRVTRVYNGCGILVAQIKAGQHPDAYLACDVSFVPPVQEWFGPSTTLSETDIVLLAPKGNPRQLRTVSDLAAPGLKLGVANARQSTLGDLTEKLLRAANVFDGVMANVKSQTPTADLLVNQLRTGSLDAVVVYEANTSQVRDTCEVIRLSIAGAKATQPYTVGVNTAHRQLMGRLLDALRTEDSRRHYESLGFRWKGGAANP